jgi:hypothetical protein
VRRQRALAVDAVNVVPQVVIRSRSPCQRISSSSVWSPTAKMVEVRAARLRAAISPKKSPGAIVAVLCSSRMRGTS